MKDKDKIDPSEAAVRVPNGDDYMPVEDCDWFDLDAVEGEYRIWCPDE